VKPNTVKYCIFSVLCLLLVWSLSANAAEPATAKEPVETRLAILKDQLLSYFAPATGKVTNVQGMTVQLATESGTVLKPGMRLQSFQEGVAFVHPVTKEQLGRVEMPVGSIEVVSVSGNTATATILDGKPEAFRDAKVKVPATKRKVLFYQGMMDWNLGDAYYQMLKDTDRFELFDTPLETDDLAKLTAEAQKKGAEALVVLSSEGKADEVAITQKVYWAKDGKQLFTNNTAVSVASIRELRQKAGIIGSGGEVLLAYRLPFASRRLTAGDLEGDGNQEIVLVGGNSVRVYKPDVDLKLLWEFDIPKNDDTLWIDTIDMQGKGRDMIAITVIRTSGNTAGSDAIVSNIPFGRGVISQLYELQGNTVRPVWTGQNMFIRALGGELIAQEFDPRDGYTGPVMVMKWNGTTLVKSREIALPKDVNIYDFQILTAASGTKAIIAWDENGFVNLYNEKGIRIWVSKEDFGVTLYSFKREGGSFMSERGKWTVKDRLLGRYAEVLAPKRKPLLSYAKGLGNSATEIKSFWWNGVSLEERVFIEEMGGDIIDYALSGDRLYVIGKPLFGFDFKNLMRGESPFGSMLYVFSIKGR